MKTITRKTVEEYLDQIGQASLANLIEVFVGVESRYEERLKSVLQSLVEDKSVEIERRPTPAQRTFGDLACQKLQIEMSEVTFKKRRL